MKSLQQYISESKEEQYGYNIVADVEGEKCSQEDLKEIRKIASKYNIEDDDEGNFYCYNTNEYNQFVKELKDKKIGGRIFLYRGVSPDYEWKLVDTLKFS